VLLQKKKKSYAVPAEVGKVGVESPTFIEPVQKRKDGIEAMFMRQTKAKEPTTTPAAAAVGSGKRKHEHESSSPSPAAAAATAPSSSPSRVKRAKAEKKDPVKPKEIVDVDAGDSAAEGHNSSDVEILPSPGPYSASAQSVIPLPLFFSPLPSSLSHACVNFFFAKVAAKPRAQKREQDDAPMSGSQQQQVSHAPCSGDPYCIESNKTHPIVFHATPCHAISASAPYLIRRFTVLLSNGYQEKVQRAYLPIVLFCGS
jgi:hypothetical protein